MGLLFAGSFVSIISSYRLLWIGGRFGGHKTSLGYKLAEGYLNRGYRLISNNRSIWGDEIEQVTLCNDHGQLHAVVVLDEGGLSFKSSRQIEMIASYARKMDVIYIIPSFWPPTRAAQVLIAQPVFNFKGAGIPLIVYKWRVKVGAFTDSGWFFWWKPKEIYGIYSTADPGDTAEEIVGWLIDETEKYRLRFGYQRDSVREMEEPTEAETLADAVESFAGAVDDLAAIPIRSRRRRRV